MKYQLLIAILVTGFISTTTVAQEVSVDVTLRPAGSFVAKTNRVKGTASKTATGVSAENVLVDLRSLSTGIALRDKHLKERLMVEKHPVAKLIKATGADGKGKATIQLKGHTQEVSGTYTVDGSKLNANFKMLLSKLDITGVKYMGVGVSDEITIHVSIPIK